MNIIIFQYTTFRVTLGYGWRTILHDEKQSIYKCFSLARPWEYIIIAVK